MSVNTISEKQQEEKLANSLKLAAGVGAYIKCVSCPNTRAEPNGEDMTISEFVYNELYKNGWRYGVSLMSVFDKDGNHDGEVECTGPHCRYCTGKEGFKQKDD